MTVLVQHFLGSALSLHPDHPPFLLHEVGAGEVAILQRTDLHDPGTLSRSKDQRACIQEAKCWRRHQSIRQSLTLCFGRKEGKITDSRKLCKNWPELSPHMEFPLTEPTRAVSR